MQGVQYITDDTGHRTAAIIDLERWGEQLQDFLDGLEAETEPKEPTVSWKALKTEMEEEASHRVRS